MTAHDVGDTAVFAISYDPVDVLRDFSEKYGITFTLLSDVGSATIERFGLLNRHVEAQQAYYEMPVTDRHRGLPYPATFMLDETGIIVDRRFEQSYRVRPAGTLLFEDLLGHEVGEPQVSSRAQGLGLQAVAWLNTETYRPQQGLRLRIALEVDPDLHVYAPPTPSGFKPLQIELADLDGLVVDPPVLPSGRPFTIEGIEEEFLVYTGRVETKIPFRISRDLGSVALKIRVGYQACSETVCHPPGELRLELGLEGREVLRP